MKLAAKWMVYGDDNQYTGYFAAPKAVRDELPAVLVLQEIWGVDDHIEDLVHRFAQAGYAAFAPDLYALGGKRPAAHTVARIEAAKRFMDSLAQGAWANEEQRAEALSLLAEDEAAQVKETLETLFAGARATSHVEQLLASTQFLRDECVPTQGQAVLSVGFCMGGALSAQLACHDPALRAAAIFYGSAPPPDLLPGIQCPVIGFYGGLDPNITDGMHMFAEAMRLAGKAFEHHVYPGAGHAFFNDTRKSYHAPSARHSFGRLLSFFAHHAD